MAESNILPEVLRDELNTALAEIERLKLIIKDYEDAIDWDTTCLGCSKLIDQNYEAYVEIQNLTNIINFLEGDLK